MWLQLKITNKPYVSGRFEPFSKRLINSATQMSMKTVSSHCFTYFKTYYHRLQFDAYIYIHDLNLNIEIII